MGVMTTTHLHLIRTCSHGLKMGTLLDFTIRCVVLSGVFIWNVRQPMLTMQASSSSETSVHFYKTTGLPEHSDITTTIIIIIIIELCSIGFFCFPINTAHSLRPIDLYDIPMSAMYSCLSSVLHTATRSDHLFGTPQCHIIPFKNSAN